MKEESKGRVKVQESVAIAGSRDIGREIRLNPRNSSMRVTIVVRKAIKQRSGSHQREAEKERDSMK